MAASCLTTLSPSRDTANLLISELQTVAERGVAEGVAARVVGVLEFVETPVEVAAGEELLVRALLAKFAVV